jgi:hypothetical protein
VFGFVEAECKKDEKLIGGGGGFANTGPVGGKAVEESRPAPQRNAWLVQGDAQAAGGGTLRAYAICLPR